MDNIYTLSINRPRQCGKSQLRAMILSAVSLDLIDIIEQTDLYIKFKYKEV